MMRIATGLALWQAFLSSALAQEPFEVFASFIGQYEVKSCLFYRDGVVSASGELCKYTNLNLRQYQRYSGLPGIELRLFKPGDPSSDFYEAMETVRKNTWTAEFTSSEDGKTATWTDIKRRPTFLAGSFLEVSFTNEGSQDVLTYVSKQDANPEYPLIKQKDEKYVFELKGEPRTVCSTEQECAQTITLRDGTVVGAVVARIRSSLNRMLYYVRDLAPGGYIWAPASKDMNWVQASNYCASIKDLGKEWSLPDKDAFKFAFNPSNDSTYIMNTNLLEVLNPGNSSWSSTSKSARKAYAFHETGVLNGAGDKVDDAYQARCVSR